MIRSIPIIFALMGLLSLAGCAAASRSAEHAARTDLQLAGQRISPTAAELPTLTPTSPPEDFVRAALLRHPAVRAAFLEWRASVEAIAPAAALPDPKLTFQADISNMIMSLMPGVMFDIMAPGRRDAMGREAAAGAAVARRRYEAVLVRVAADVWKTLVDAAYVDEAVRLREASVETLQRTGRLAASAYAAGRGMEASLEEQIRTATGAERLRSEIAALADRRVSVRARLKSALGLAPSDPDPVWPERALSPTPLPAPDELWRRVQAANADLAVMRSMVEMSVAGEEVAARAGSNDFSAGLMADVKQAPWMWRPSVSMSLPVWRAKLDGLVQQARAKREAAAARVEAETVAMAAELARMLFMVRESDRMVAYLDSSAIPSVLRTRESSASSYLTGSGSPAMIAGTATMELAMRMERLAALRDRELAVVEILAMTADVAPRQP